MSVKIERDVPLPTSRATYHHYPFQAMEPGDSFHVIDIDGRTAHRLQVQVSIQHSKTARRYTSRRDATGVRIWRLE